MKKALEVVFICKLIVKALLLIGMFVAIGLDKDIDAILFGVFYLILRIEV